MNKQLLKIKIQSLLIAILMILGVSLDLSAKTTVNGFDPVIFTFEPVSGELDEIVCIDVTVENFVSVEGMQFTIVYNTNLLSIECPVDISNSPLGIDLFFNCQDDDGTIRVLWTDPDGGVSGGVSIPDGEVVFTLCFTINSTAAISSPITIAGYPVPVEISQIPPTGPNCIADTLVSEEGIVEVEFNDLTISAFKCDASGNSADGSISFFIAGGSEDYDYEVNPGAYQGTVGEGEYVRLENLTQDTYTITATDNVSGQVINSNLILTDIGSLSVDLVGTDPFCFNRDKGSIETTVTNSFGDEIMATYEWSNFRFTQDIEDLSSGTYTVTVTDLNGCSATATETLFVEPLNLYIELIDSASCEGNNDAIVKIWADGGTPFPSMPNPEYNFETDADDGGPIDTFLLNNVETGIFNFSVIDAAIPLCQVDSFIEIPFKGIDLSIDIDTTNISCFGADDGSATITGIGSTNFGIIVRDENNMLVAGAGGANQSTFTDLTAGDYTVLAIESFNGCEITGSFSIEEPAELSLTTDNVLNPGCVGNDGMILLSTDGGTEPYEYMWSDGPASTEDRNGLSGGMYIVTVTDDRGCTDTATFTLPNGEDVQINANVVQTINCPQDENGIIDVVISTGGTFIYNWETPDGTFVSDMQTVSNLGSGVYYVTATDDTGSCTALDTVILTAASPITVEGNFTEPTCPGVPNGTIGINVIEGTGPFDYLWFDDSTLPVLSGISEGTYNVTITDANMCEQDTFLTLTAPDPILVDFTDIVGVDCFGTANGSITATANGGPEMVNMYTYFWSNDPTNGFTATSSVQAGFPAGENWVIATDFFCASDTIFFTIPDIDSIAIDMTNSVISSPSCFGDCDGVIDIVAVGGNPASYDYTWLDDNSNNPMRMDLCPGTYDVMIEDANGCTVTRSIELINPELLTVAIDSIKEIGCNENGHLEVTTNGGTEPYAYTWTGDVSIDSIATDLEAGTYTILVTDANNCTAETAYTLVPSVPVTAVIGDIEEPDCFGDLTCINIESASGGDGSNYTYRITPDGFEFPIDSCAAVYADEITITVNDFSGCAWDTTFIISQPDEIMVDAGPDQEIDLGSTSEVISPNIDSSLPIADISWSPMDSIQCLDSDCQDITTNTLLDQLYTVTVVDENGCSATDDILITVNTSRNVYIANIFTPDGDGTNDFFNIVIGSGAVSVSYLSIYDRWGNRVFAIENEYIPEVGLQDGWDGKHNGQFVNPGVYIYTAQVNFLDGRVLQYSGDITVIR